MSFPGKHVKLYQKERSPLRAFFGGKMRTIDWDDKKQAVLLIDQRRLPERLVIFRADTADQMITAIKSMAIRGAPALGVAGAFAVALAAKELEKINDLDWFTKLEQSAISIKTSRPTAVNLAWGVNRVMSIPGLAEVSIKEAAGVILNKAIGMAEEDVSTNLMLAKNGSTLINDGDVLLHHCNTGALATVDWGTALGAIRFAHESGKKLRS